MAFQLNISVGNFTGNFVQPNGTVLTGQFTGSFTGTFLNMSRHTPISTTLYTQGVTNARLQFCPTGGIDPPLIQNDMNDFMNVLRTIPYDIHSHQNKVIMTCEEKTGFLSTIDRFNSESLLHKVRNNVIITDEFLKPIGYEDMEIETILDFIRTGRVKILLEYMINTN